MPATYTRWKRSTAYWLKARRLSGPTPDGPLEVHIVVRLREVKAGTGPDVRPDLDNLVKSVLDAGTAAGLWHDDAQIVRLVAEKVRGTPGFTLEVLQHGKT